jgi:photosystem II stability/assembly factor-like uncharacterized protein
MSHFFIFISHCLSKLIHFTKPQTILQEKAARSPRPIPFASIDGLSIRTSIQAGEIAMKSMLVHFSLSLVFLAGAAWAQLQRLPIQHVKVKPALEAYNSFLTNRLQKAQAPGPGSGEKPFRRLEWFLESRLQPDGSYPAGARWNAYLDVLANREAPGSAEVPAANWTSLGPNNIAGRILDLAFDPNNPGVIWAGAASGGIWRSANDGQSWAPRDDQLPTLAIGCIVTHPTHSNIIYMGTGEGSFNIDAVDGVGVLKSTDGGATWSQTGLSWLLSQGQAVNEMVIDPVKPNVLVAATRDGVYRTDDAGVSWKRTLAAATGWMDAKDLVIDPSNSNILFAAAGYPWGSGNNGIYKSTDNGVTWTKLAGGLPGGATMGRASLAISASNPNTVYAGIARTINSGASLLGIYRTTDGGETWTRQSNSPNHYSAQGWYNNVIAVDPANPNIVYSGGMNIYKSTDGGVTWATITNGIHVDFHAIAFNNGALYAGTDGGVYKSTTGGSSWTSLNSGLVTMQFYKMGSDFNNANKAMGGTQDNGTNEYRGGPGWTKRLGGDGGEVIYDYSNSNIIYAEYQNGSHLKSLDGGVSWFAADAGVPSGPWVTPVEMDPANPNVLYTIGSGNLYKTSNGAGSWSLLFNAAEALEEDIQVAPSDPQTIYVAGDNVIYRSANGGASFSKISAGLAVTNITALAVHPEQPQTLYVTIGGWNAASHVYKTTNAGGSWQNMTKNLPNVPCNTIVIDPLYPEMVYVGTDLGVFVSTDGGETWNDWNTGLPNVVVDELDIQASARVIRAATHGRGMYQANLLEARARPAPAAPSQLTAIATASDQILLTWQDNSSNEDGFKIERKMGTGTSTGGAYAEIATVGAGVTSYANSGLAEGTTYSYRLRAYNDAGLSAYSNVVSAATPPSSSGNLALNKAAAALSTKSSYAPANAIDGKADTYWLSGSVSSKTPMWWAVDLGAVYTISRVVITWKSSYYAKEYEVQVSSDGLLYNAVYEDHSGNGGTEEIDFPATSARYLRVYMTRHKKSSARIAEVEIYAGPGAAWSRNLAEESEVAKSEVITDYMLEQSYPNPFSQIPRLGGGNPSTKISFTLPEAGKVKLQIYDLLGNLVTTLANGRYASGKYEMIWNGRNRAGEVVAGGVYLYRLTVERNGEAPVVMTRKLTVLK